MKPLAVIILLAAPVYAQSFSFGIKSGVPLTDAFSTRALPDMPSYSSVNRPYVVGPTAEVKLPLFDLGVEADALYHRMGWDASRTASPLFEPYQATVRLGAWEFDALVKRRMGGGLRPYLGAGAAFRRFFTTRANYSFAGQPSFSVSEQMISELQHKNIAGIVFSAGMEFGGGALRIAPEIRYTRWLMNNVFAGYPVLSTQANQAEALVSITYGKRR